MRLLLTTLALAAATQAQLVTFSAGSPAKASDVNGNFAYLAARLDSLTKALAAKDAGTPKGTIAAFLTEPGKDSYLPGSNQTWIIAAGQGEENGVVIPDLRGQFLRGIDLTVTGAKNIAYDPDGKRVSGSQQDDAFQGHWHEYYHKAGTIQFGGSADADLYDGPHSLQVGSFVQNAVTDGTNGTPRVASETRPKNVAIYWYIKVK